MLTVNKVRNMLNKSIAYQLGIYISLAVISVFVGFIIISYLFNRNTMRHHIESKAIAESAKITAEVKKLVVTTQEVSSNLSQQILFYGAHNEAEMLISGVMKKYPFINSIYVHIDSSVAGQPFHRYMASRPNGVMQFQKDKFEIVCNEGFQDIAKHRIPTWSQPFRCLRNNNVVVRYYHPIHTSDGKNESKYAGDVICELSLLNLNDIINSLKIGERGFAFLITENGDYITHPRKEWILNRNVFSLPEKIVPKKGMNVLKKIISEQKQGSMIVHPEILNYEKSWVYYMPIHENRWTLIFIMPYDELFSPLYQNILWLLFISVIGILAVYFLITLITNKLVEPLSNITSQLKKFSVISDEYTVDTFNEVQLVSESLKNLKTRFDKYNESHTQEQKKSHSRMEDLLQASEIQRSLIKSDFPAFPERDDIELFALYKPAKIVSGDLYDYFFLDEDNLVISMGDVSGKGIPAAFFMSVAQTIIKGNANVKKAKSIVNKANKELYTNNQHQFFLTLFLGVLNLKTHTLSYCNAAHTTALLLKPNGEIRELEHSHGLPLGLYPDKEYSESKIKIDKCDTLILYTDGVTELQDSNKFHFGIERFKENLNHLAECQPKEIAQKIEKSLEIFKGEAEQSDDISIMVIRYF